MWLGRAEIDAVPQTAEGLAKAMFDEPFETWGQVYDTHVTSVYFTTAAFLPLLTAAKSVGGWAEPGTVVNIASLSGITRTSQRGQFGYNASKAATIHLSLMQATEFARRGLGIRVNSISPGYFPSVRTRGDTADSRVCRCRILASTATTTRGTGRNSMGSRSARSGRPSIMRSVSSPLLLSVTRN